LPDANGQPVHVVPPPLAGGPWPDAAIDAALAKVPLPDGLLGRLNALISSLPDVCEHPSG
jgi:hypothetical protein